MIAEILMLSRKLITKAMLSLINTKHHLKKPINVVLGNNPMIGEESML